MRILLAVSEYHRGGGFPRHGADLAVALSRIGHDVTVLTQRAETRDEDAALAFRTYDVPGRSLIERMNREPEVVTPILRAALDEFDGVVSVGIPSLAPVVMVGPGTHWGYVQATRATMPKAGPRYWLEPFRPFHRTVLRWERRMLGGNVPSVVVVGGDTYRLEYTEHYGMPEDKVVTIPHGVAVEEFRFDAELRERTRRELGIAPDTRVMLNVANRFRQKGLDTVAAALPLLPRDRDWQFLFAGSGSTARPLRARTARLAADGRVRLLGRVPDIVALYCAADLLVFPSRYDPWGMAVTEAIACGTPAICSSHLGSAQAVRPGVNGDLLPDPEDARDLAARVERLLWAEHDRAAVRATVEQLTWEASAAGLADEIARRASRAEADR